jgi:proline dehydrogenase
MLLIASHSTAPRLRDRMITRVLPLMPRWIVARMSRRYIAGSTIDDAVNSVRAIAAHGMSTTVDVLGEAITKQEEAVATRDEYLRVIDELGATGNADLVNVSIKLTALGLDIDRDIAVENVRRIARHAARYDGFVRIDMEDSPYTDATLDIYDELVADGVSNLGVVIQSYLHRSAGDVERLARTRARVRVVKGIYVEPAQIAWHEMERINASYLELSRSLATAGCHVAFATHDEGLIAGALDIVEDLNLDRSSYEFQMLLGVREELGHRLQAAGHPVRIYIPFGARWYEYSLRRLRENPRIAGLVAKDVLRSWRRRSRKATAG